MKSVRWHPHARDDADQIADWYAQQGGLALELAFTDALESAIDRIAHHPGIGASRYSERLFLRGLRCWPTDGFPYLVFYIEHETHIDVWRVLHAQRDIPAWMGDTE